MDDSLSLQNRGDRVQFFFRQITKWIGTFEQLEYFFDAHRAFFECETSEMVCCHIQRLLLNIGYLERPLSNAFHDRLSFELVIQSIGDDSSDGILADFVPASSDPLD